MVTVGRFMGGRPRVIWLGVGMAAACAGKSIEDIPVDGGAGAGGAGGTAEITGGRAGTGGPGARAGEGGTGGRAGEGGGATATGGRADAGVGGTVGTGGNSARDCTFEALPAGRRCASSAAYAQDEELARLEGVAGLSACEAACASRSNCTAATFYPRFETPGRCALYTTPCDAPRQDSTSEENAAKEYRKVCDDDGCRLEFVGQWYRCEGADVDPMLEVTGAQSPEDCFAACLENPDCTGVSDYLWLDDVPGCYLASGNCEEDAGLPPGDPGRTLVAQCDGQGGGGAAGAAGETGEPEPKPPTRLALGSAHTCLLLSDQRVRCWGSDARTVADEYGDIVVPGAVHPPEGPFTRVAADRYSTCATDSNGRVQCWPWAWPANQTEVVDLDGDPMGTYVELRADGKAYGAGRFASPKLFASVARGSSVTCGLDQSARAVCSEELTPPARPFRRIAAGGGHACGLTFDGAILCWGAGDEGATDAPDGEFKEIATGPAHSCAIDAGGELVCWGADDFGQATPPAGIFTSVEVGAHHSCAIRSGNDVECWGSNEGFQSSPPADLRPPTVPFVDVAAGGAAFYNGRLVSGGGSEDEEPWSEWTPKALAAHGCGLRSDGRLECFGAGDAARAPSGVFRGISAGVSATCALREDGFFCFGNPNHLLDGLEIAGSFESLSTGWDIVCAVDAGGALACWGLDQPGPLLSPGGTYGRVAAGGGGGGRWPAQACGIGADENITCWTPRDGEAPEERLIAGPFIDVAVGYAHACGVLDGGTVKCWHSSYDTELPAPPGTFVKVVAGDDQSCALGADGRVTCWRIGYSSAPFEIPEGEVPGSFSALSMGGDFACGVLLDGGLKCWGSRVR